MGTVREIRIYKKAAKNWVVLASSKDAVGKSEDGGMMGDPFEGIEVKNGILIINQSGGSSWKWSISDKYRFQNGIFQLIGHTSNYGKPCEYFQDIDFNIATGKIIFTKEYESCDDGDQKAGKKENETFYKKGLKIDLSQRHAKEIVIESPKFKHQVYL